jgi:hypothetical protein
MTFPFPLMEIHERIVIEFYGQCYISAAEMKYTRITAGYTWTDYKTNTQNAKELKTT